MLIECINITAMDTNEDLLQERSAHLVAIQEHRVPQQYAEAKHAAFRSQGWCIELGRLIQGTAGNAGGVGLMSRLPDNVVVAPALTESCKQATKSGRVGKYIVPLNPEIEVVVFVIYGAARGHDDREARALTDSIISAVHKAAMV